VAIIADRILLVGGSYDGCIVDFVMGRMLAMHDPLGSRPDELYCYNLEAAPSLNGDIIVRSARYVGLYTGEEDNKAKGA